MGFNQQLNEALFSDEIQKGEFAELRVQFISLVKHPANRRPVLIKSDTGVRFELPARLIRKDGTARKIFGVVYEPGVIDTQGDSASALVIERAAHEFLALGLVKMVDFQHDFTPGKGTVVESFILNGTDDRFPGVQKGAWVVVIEVGAEMADHIDEIGGLSLAGQGVYKSVETNSTSTNRNTQQKTNRQLARHSTRKVLARLSKE